MDKFWEGKRVFITGHTGFKGSWLSLWLQTLGAQVIGYALQPPSNPSLFDAAHVSDGMISLEGDILDYPKLQVALQKHKPDIVIHMAAQSLVRNSYQYPIETLSTNIIGTANVLETVRHTPEVQVVINVTSDKCYENREWVWGYRENESMGGHDPYSCSKGCAELVISSYRRSYFSADHTGNIASVRAGNVIGGGDWAIDRIVPDCIRAIHKEQSILLRNPHAIRPWQHVLEPLSGYLLLVQKLWDGGKTYAEGWNFGPNESHAWSVGKMVDVFCRLWGQEAKWSVNSCDYLHEAHYLKLDSSKARHKLGWYPVLNMQDTLAMTVEWYKRYFAGEDPRAITLEQIAQYQKICKENGDVC
ncbi:CDP-glucose 4,6-dehydratase [Anaerospora sp.]|uniref:CDP-glucose 4,6-dehydratase n=1 Tax=Anaerospora sp. TaxID=1960278 RepID=UPI00289FC86E|nr:CDP-glucose 4,6-dehydratase [Anaerospora sp.]